jgi:hypothetical protein
MNKLILAVLCARAACAATPTLTELQPRGAQQGRTFTLALLGRELLDGSRIITTLPAVVTPLTPTMKSFPFLIELRQDALVGTYPIRIQNAAGLSNILLFTVGSFPEVTEIETVEPTNNTIATAELVKATPITINGTLKGADRDFYRITAKAGERRVFEVEARRSGSAIDPVLELYDEKSNLLARNADAPGLGVDSRIDFTFPRDGNYFIEVHDARFSKQDQNFYRLKIGAYTYPESVFPLGGRHGETVSFEFTSKTGAVKSSVKLPETGSLAMIPMPGSPALPLIVALSDAAELTEPLTGALPIPSLVNGRIAKPGEVDRYKLMVTPGESLLLELQSRELGASRLDALLTITDARGKKLAAAGEALPSLDVTSALLVGRTQGDPFLNFKVPADTSEISVAIEDLAGRGGNDFGYRLSVRRQAEDFILSASPAYLNVPRGATAQVVVTAERRGYDGAIHASIPNLPRGWTSEGGFIAPETMDAGGARALSRRGVITLTAAQDAEQPASELTVVADGGSLHRQATGAGVVIDIAAGTGLADIASTDRQKPFTAPWLNMAMPASVAKEPLATISIKQIRRTHMDEGDAFDFEWNIDTKDKSLAMPATINVDAPGARDLRVIDMKPAAKGAPAGTFRITTTKTTVPGTYDLVVNASLMPEGQQRETIVSRAISWKTE